ncbi:MAG: hypothetical protein ACRCV3_03830 [Desulfovibrionaceae bacterium]
MNSERAMNAVMLTRGRRDYFCKRDKKECSTTVNSKMVMNGNRYGSGRITR